MALPPDFASESLYTADQWYIHDLVEMDHEGHRIVALMDTTRLGAAVAAQQPWPGQPKHVPGMVMVQATGTLGNLHAVYTLGLRMSAGWVGFGGRIDNARFSHLARIGPPVITRMHARKLRRLRDQVFVSYDYLYEQEGHEVYRSRQMAAWSRHGEPT